MPPKRKKTSANLVVGTVSTRSTRRQSIVNIDIPKLTRSNKSMAKTPKEPNNKNELAENEEFQGLSSKIKESYKELMEYESSFSPKKSPQEIIDRDNRALLEILQDWDDEDEDQNEKSSQNCCRSISNPNVNKTVGIDSEINNSNINQLSANKQIELLLSEGLEDAVEEINHEEVKGNFSMVQDDNRSEDINIEIKDENSLSTGGTVQTEPEEVIIEENASVPYADDMLPNIPLVKTEKLDEDEVPEAEAVAMEEVIEENVQVTETIQVEETIYETSQSSSDTQGFVANNDDTDSNSLIVNEDTQNMECVPFEEEELQQIVGVQQEQTAIQEDNDIASSLIEELEARCSSEKLVELDGEEEKMECEFEVSTEAHEFEQSTKDKEENGHKKINKIESELSNFSSIFEEKEKIFESLENKVAEMNLTGESQNQESSTLENVGKIESENLKIPIAPKKSDTIQQQKSYTKKEVNKSKTTSDKDKKSTKQSKSKSSKTYKPPTFKINKDKKSETKQKKTESEKQPKKSKDKPNSKEPDKVEKKSEKKLTKFEEILQNISKTDSEGEEVRRSSRIKSINVMNRKISGWGLVKSKSETTLNDGDNSDSNSFHTESDKSTPTASPKVTSKDRKSKSNSELPIQVPIKVDNQIVVPFKNEYNCKVPGKDPVVTARLKQFIHLKENLYKTDRMVCKEAKKMVCDCFLTPEEFENDGYGCGDDCLNRLLFIECGNLCGVSDRCTNKRFQKSHFAPVEVFNTEKKGLGLRAAANIPFGEFILEYVGEVLNNEEFDKRAEVYSQDKNIHYYFMALRADAIIDATMKGNISRFINHSCDPNAETQKWTVNGELRIGFFSTRTILAGEEITFDYRFQRYGKEAQKCYCGASICRGWLGEQPDSDEEEEEDEEEESEEIKSETPVTVKDESISSQIGAEIKDEIKMDITNKTTEAKDTVSDTPIQDSSVPAVSKTILAKKKVQRKKPRFEMFEEVDQLNEEIEMLLTTGLKNQAHTLKLSRLMVRAKEPQQRAKLLRVLRRGELPCRRLFLDYHGLRLMHGYMIDAQQLVISNKKYESLRLEVLQTLAVLPIPNKTMLQDSKVFTTVEKWSTIKNLTSPADSESNSPKDGAETLPKVVEIKEEKKESVKDEQASERSIEDQEEEIKFLATKLLEEWKNLKEVFRIPKKERIEQMKEHEREANKKFMQTNQNTYGSEEDKKMDRYRGITKGKVERDQGNNRKPNKSGDKPSAEFLRLSKIERRKLFALQHELKEEERKLKQREMWRQHEINCMMIGADPRFTAPFDPSRGYQYIWNQQIGQWQTVPIQSDSRIYPPQHPPAANINLGHPHLAKPLPGYSNTLNFTPPLNISSSMGMVMNQPTPPMPIPLSQTAVPGHMPPIPQNPLSAYHGQSQLPMTTAALPQMPPLQQIADDTSQVKFMGPIPLPAKLPPKWKCTKDKYGRPYYYHIKIRKSQWEPPAPTPELADVSDSESSSESSTVSSDSSSENSDSDDEIDDTRLLLEVRRQMDSLPEASKSETIDLEHLDDIPTKTPSPDEKSLEGEIHVDDLKTKNLSLEEEIIRRPSIDMRLKELDLFKDVKPPKKKRRVGLCEEIIISPRTEEDKKQFKEDLKRYKANKEKLKRQKEKILLQTKKQLREIEMKKVKDKRLKTTVKVKLKEKPDFNSETARKIKETFRTNMASTVVCSLNAYRKPDCTEGRITNTQDFKHLARKLTHFVMLKEMKHITKIEELTCTDNVKMKAREFIRKYMSKFGEVYIKRSDSPDFKD